MGDGEYRNMEARAAILTLAQKMEYYRRRHDSALDGANLECA